MKKIIKYLVFGFVALFAALGFGIVVVVFVGYTNGVFDEPIAIVPLPLYYRCLAVEGKFESYYKENELIGVCEYIQSSENLYGYDNFWRRNPYLWNDTIKQDCKQEVKETDEYGIAVSAEYSEDKRGKGFCKKRIVFWIKK